MNEYSRLAAQFGKVRRAWKRTAVLSGLFMVLVESAGIFAVLLLFGWFYREHPTACLVALILALGAVGYLIARHMVAPLCRRIPDEQVALYVEEHSQEFEGALITAAEFGRREYSHPQQAGMIGAVVRAASARAERSSPSRVVDLARLRKYGLVALVLAAGYAASFLFIPDVTHHAVRVITPWRVVLEIPSAPAGQGEVIRTPVEISLSYPSARIPRKSSLEAVAALSWASKEPLIVKHPVMLHFRPVGRSDRPAKWEQLRMKLIEEKVNTFKAELAFLMEEMEFFVSVGPDRSPARRVAVYDPLVVTGVEVVTRYPEYLKLPDRLETQTDGYVSAPGGSKVTVRILANRPLVGGRLTWDDGGAQDLAADPERKNSASVSFEVRKNCSYAYKVVSDDAQEAGITESLPVRVVPDDQPRIELKYPNTMITTHPLGEIPVLVEASDDFGVEGADLVYARGASPNAPEVRIPMQFRRPPGTQGVLQESVPGALNVRLEDLKPGIVPEECLSFYVECRDRKGQKAVTDIVFVTVGPFDVWGTILPSEFEEEPGDEEIKDLEPYLRATWHLHREKDQVSASDFTQRCDALVASMINPKTQRLYAFHKKIKDAVKAAHAKKADGLIAAGHKALRGYDTASAVANFRLAMAELALAGLVTEIVQEMSPGQVTGEAGGGQPQSTLDAARREAQRKDTALEKPTDEPRKEEAKLAEDIKRKAGELEKEQEKIIQKGAAMAKDGSKAEGEPQTAQSGPAQGGEKPETPKELGGKQEQLAEKTKGVANEASQKGAGSQEISKTAEAMNRAAQAMNRAAQGMRAGNMPQALQDANQAKAELRAAQTQLKGAEQEKLENLIAEAESRAAKLLGKQRDTRGKTEEVGKSLTADKQPDAKQERDLKKLTYDQVQHKVELGNVAKEIEELQKKVKEGQKGDAAKEVENAHREMQRGQVDQKMAGAAVDLSAGSASSAAKQQKEAEAGLEKVVERLRKASDALAADPESELRRAKGEAERIERDLSKLSGKPTSQSAASRSSQDQGQQKPPTAEEKGEIAERLPYEIKRLADHLENRAFAERTDTDFLKSAAQNAGALSQRLKDEAPKNEELLTTVRRVRDKLEAEYAAMLEAQRLFAAQREECPPQYRRLVNKYYEAVSRIRVSAPGGK